jgi:transposase
MKGTPTTKESAMETTDSAPDELESGYSNWREYRRNLAWDMVQKGVAQKTVAELLDVTQAAVSQWVKRAREEGRAALEAKPSPERARKLAHEHIDNLRRLLTEGAEAHGFGERWTTANISELITDHFGVDYHPAHVSRMLKQWGFVWVGLSGWVMMTP